MGEKLISWSSDFETGIKQIDKQHFKLVDILNNLYFHFGENSDDRAKIDEILNELYYYTDYHFDSEEKVFFSMSNDIDRTKKHIQEHKKFLFNVKEYIRKFKANEENLSLQLILYLKDWIIDHVMYVDRRFLQSLKQ